MEIEPNWDDLRLLLAVAQRGSFLGAAKQLNLAVSTVSRRLTKLEDTMGYPLLERGVDGSTLTTKGRALADISRDLSRDIEHERDKCTGESGRLSGLIRLTTGDGFLSFILDVIAGFSAVHPDCIIEYATEAEYRKVARGEVDVAVRVANLGEPSLIYKKVAPIAFGIFATKTYRASLPLDVKPHEVDFISVTGPLLSEPHMRTAQAAGFTKSRLRMSSFSGQIAAVDASLGAAVLPRVHAQHLDEIFPEIVLPSLEAFVVTRPSALQQPHLRAFVDAICEGLKPRRTSAVLD